MARDEGKGPADRNITVTAKVCGQDHGGPNNDAEVYGHFASNRTCVRLGKSNTWIYDPTEAQAKEGTMMNLDTTPALVEPTMIVTSTIDVGARFLVRILRAGEAYGLTGALTADENMVEFYDTRYPRTEYGQFIGRYYVSTILDDRCPHDRGYRFGEEGCRHTPGGIDLAGGVDSWKIDASGMNIVRAWLAHEV